MASGTRFWSRAQEAEREPLLVSFLFAAVLRHRRLEDGLGVILASKLQTQELPAILLRDLIIEAFADEASIRGSIRADLLAARTRDPASRGYACTVPLLQGISRAAGLPRGALAVGT